jgi:hypothetical protein
MSGVIKIIRGRQKTAGRFTVYGTEGIGKSTLASQFPTPLILDTEDGTRHLDCARAPISSWKDLTLAMTELAINAQGFKTVVIDSADWAEKLLVEWLLKGAGKNSIEDFGFGKGYVMLQEHVARFLASADVLVRQGIHVVFVAHSKVVRTSPPDQTDGYDRWELKLTKQVAPLFKEWSDALIFCNFKTKLVEGADGRMKARGGKDRIMYAERSAAWDAKNRFGLPAEMPMEIGQLASVFEGVTPVAPLAPVAKKPLWSDRVKEATDGQQLAAIDNEATEAKERGELTEAQLAKLHASIEARLEALEAGEVANVSV